MIYSLLSVSRRGMAVRLPADVWICIADFLQSPILSRVCRTAGPRLISESKLERITFDTLSLKILHFEIKIVEQNHLLFSVNYFCFFWGDSDCKGGACGWGTWRLLRRRHVLLSCTGRAHRAAGALFCTPTFVWAAIEG